MSRIFLSAPDICGRERQLVDQAFDSNYVAPAGAMLKDFEEQMSAYTGIEHAVALSSGTAAMHLAVHLAEIGEGDEVWTTSMTFIGGVSPITYARATPVFVDIAAESWTIDCDILEEELGVARRANRLPKAIISTDLYGQSSNLDRLTSICRQYGVLLISDSAEALGAFFKDRHAGKGATATVLSFNGNKIITTSGGGMLLSDDRSLIDRARYLSTQARQPALHYQHTEVGFNYRLSNICAAIGIGQLEMIEKKVARRRQLFERYKEALGHNPGIAFMPEPEWSRATRWLTCMTVDPMAAGVSNHDFVVACDAADIEVRPLWKPMHLQPVFAGSRFLGSGLCERLFATGLCLPSGSGMSNDEHKQVLEALARVVATKH